MYVKYLASSTYQIINIVTTILNKSNVVFYNLKNAGVVFQLLLQPELALDSALHCAFPIPRD